LRSRTSMAGVSEQSASSKSGSTDSAPDRQSWAATRWGRRGGGKGRKGTPGNLPTSEE
jgi:hypothetical protein